MRDNTVTCPLCKNKTTKVILKDGVEMISCKCGGRLTVLIDDIPSTVENKELLLG
jgi:hypothetical protein